MMHSPFLFFIRLAAVLSSFVWVAAAVSVPAKSQQSPCAVKKIKGEAVSGGAILYQGDPNVQEVLWEDEKLPLSKDGYFVASFPWHVKKTPYKLTVLCRDDPLQRTTLVTPKQAVYKTERINHLKKIFVNPNPQEAARIHKEALTFHGARKNLQLRPETFSIKDWISPIKDARISGVYGSRRILNGRPQAPHMGQDLAAPEGTPIRAPADGRVLFVGKNMILNGNLVALDHGLGLSSVYIHLLKSAVKDDQPVKAGDIIGYIGHSGRATGPHVHWGVSFKNEPLDPAVFVRSW